MGQTRACTQYPWFEPYTLDYIEALSHIRVLGVGDYGFVQLMAHNSRKNESDNKPQQLAVKSIFKSAVTAKQFTAEKVRGICRRPPRPASTSLADHRKR